VNSVSLDFFPLKFKILNFFYFFLRFFFFFTIDKGEAIGNGSFVVRSIGHFVVTQQSVIVSLSVEVS